MKGRLELGKVPGECIDLLHVGVAKRGPTLSHKLRDGSIPELMEKVRRQRRKASPWRAGGECRLCTAAAETALHLWVCPV